MFIPESYYSQKKNADVFAFTVISCGGHVLLLITTLFPTETCAGVTQSNILATAFKLRKKGVTVLDLLTPSPSSPVL